MQIHRYDTAEQAGQAAALLIAAQVIRKPDSVLGLATGASPLGCYAQLRQWRQRGLLDFSQCVSFNLDEYCGLPESHPCSYHAFMQAHLWNDLPMKASHLPNGNAPDLAAECRRYDAAIQAAGGIDLQLLGIGRNGHIGFNEPSTALSFGTHVVELAASTMEANRRFFAPGEPMPHRAISLGVGGILAAREIVLLAMGSSKAQAIRETVEGAISPEAPSTLLRLHPHVTVLVDRAAAEGLENF